MRFTRKITFELILLALLLNFILRFPIVPHEIGWDSFVVHAAANSLSEFGYAKWWLDPSSVIGSYPYSIASAVPFFLSSISLITGLTMDSSILAYSIIIGLVSFFAVYILAMEVNEDNLFSFLAALGFSTSSAILTFSSWTGPTRTLFVVILLPLILYSLIKSITSRKYYVISLLLLGVALVTHHYIYLAIPILVSAIFLKFLYMFEDKIDFSSIYIKFIYISIFSVGILFPFVTRIFFVSERGYSGSRYGFVVLLIESFLRYSGPLLFLAFAGFIYLVFKYYKTRPEWFMLLSFASLTPFFYVETYSKWFLQTYIFIFVGFGLSNILKFKKYFAVLLILLSVVFSGYFQFIHFSDGQDRYLDDNSYNSAMWISDRVEGGMTGPSLYTTLRILSISEVPTLTISNMLNYIYGFIDYDDMTIEKRYSVFSINYYRHDPYQVVGGTDGEWYVNALSTWSIDDKRHMSLFTDSFNISYFVEDESADTNEFTYSLERSNAVDRVFSSGKISIWKVN